ncbi:hypothetical protein OG478_23505 [Streptomyces phaeochromogenes]|uniref:hypothetical protein n=1 Tax=Streptomyces phaeochromogenes TaxID=1923 RepID=UPI00386A35E6|nr:hypothetical protein OG478_23505 [Streptomyces phaeochromogenes]
MSAGQTGRGGLRSRRLRIAVGVTAAATVIGMGGAFTAQAGVGNSAPAPEKVQQVWHSDVCEEPEPVDAVPGKGELPKPGSYKDVELGDKGPVDLGEGDSVEAVPDKGELPKPGSYTDVAIDDKGRIEVRAGGPIDAVPGGGDVCVEPGPGDDDPVEAVPGDSDDVAKPDSYKDAKTLAPSKR